jgi:hypothetical protein
VNFNNKGFLPPRVALSALNSALPVIAPAEGLLVYNTAVAGTPPNNVRAGYYCWGGTKWMPVAPPQGTNVGDMQYWNGTQWVGVPAGLNGQVLTLTNGIPVWTEPVTHCGFTFTVNHQVSGGVAPVNKLVSYGTVTNIPGEPSKCWISSNLGSDHQATAVDDTTEASAGWYWQFNHKQGYKFDGITRTPNTPWICMISENSDWLMVNDPCNIELGANWRIPTDTEWQNVFNSGVYTTCAIPWNISALKIHIARVIRWTDGQMIAGTQYWSIRNNNNSHGVAYVGTGIETVWKAQGGSLRCIRDY